MGFVCRSGLSVLLLSVPAFALLPTNWELMSAQKKLLYQYGQVEKTIYTGALPSMYPTCWELLNIFNLKPSFTHKGDEMPVNMWTGNKRRRFIHKGAVVGPFSIQWFHGPVPGIDWRSHPYTGIFAGEESVGLARLSLAAPPRVAGYTPGMAAKIYVPGRDSINFHVMNSIDGQGMNQNYFENEFYSIIGEPKKLATRVIGEIFRFTIKQPNVLSMSHAAGFTSAGRRVERPNAPYKLVFVPNPRLKIDPNTKEDMRVELAKIPPGTVLYDIYAETEVGERFPLGRMNLTGQLIASSYGDEDLFFAHNSDDPAVRSVIDTPQ